jgi:hypothetical protein
MNQLQGEEFKVVVLVEPGALEVFEFKAGAAAKGQSVEKELGVWFVRFRSRLEIKNVNQTIPKLEKVNVAGEDVVEVERDFKIQEFVCCPVSGG